MLPARKDEGFHVEDGVKKDDGPIERRIEVRLLRLEDKVTVIATDLKEFKGEMKGFCTRTEDSVQSLRKVMEDGLQALRKEMGDGLQALRKETGDGLQALRKEMGDGLQALRKEMTDGSQSVRKEISDAKIWALILAAGMLGVIARGFHWI
jgi:hypothetical protein